MEPGGAHGEAAEGQASRSDADEPRAGGRRGGDAVFADAAEATPSRGVRRTGRRASACQAHPFDQQTRDKLVQGPPADRGPRRPARHDPGRGAWAAAVLPAARPCRRPALCAGHHRQGLSFGSEGVLQRAVPAWLATPPFRALVGSHDHAARQHGGAGALYIRLRRRSGGRRP